VKPWVPSPALKKKKGKNTTKPKNANKGVEHAIAVV
jgi:hypothetical protein